MVLADGRFSWRREQAECNRAKVPVENPCLNLNCFASLSLLRQDFVLVEKDGDGNAQETVLMGVNYVPLVQPQSVLVEDKGIFWVLFFLNFGLIHRDFFPLSEECTEMNRT